MSVETERSQPAATSASRRRLVLLGSTGSIGVNTLRVVENLGGAYEVVGLAAGSNADTLADQAERFGVATLAIADDDAASALQSRRPNAHVYAGPDAATQMVRDLDADVLVAAMVGAAGLPPTLEAIFQCLDAAHAADRRRELKRIVLTASGGPFLDTPLDTMRHATVEQALAHPTWKMGPKITIDSATMMNKALEIIEAHWLFGLTAEQIRVIIHPQSIVHSFVEFTDHSVLAQLGPPDMKTPIQYALTWPRRAGGCSAAMDWSRLTRLDFRQPDPQRFPALSLAYRVIELGGTAGAILNAANERAVAAFLDRAIPFGRIVDLAGEALDSIDPTPIATLDDVQHADAAARRFVSDRVAG